MRSRKGCLQVLCADCTILLGTSARSTIAGGYPYPVFVGRLAGPALEGAPEAGRVAESQTFGDRFVGHFGTRQIGRRQFEAHLVDDLLIGIAFDAQLAAQGVRM